jgi:hypothetical protein
MFQKKAQGVLDGILGHIAYYCIDHHLPPLTSIVVGKRRGKPGGAIPLDMAEIDVKREEVYNQDWYDIYPPTEIALSESKAVHNH